MFRASCHTYDAEHEDCDMTNNFLFNPMPTFPGKASKAQAIAYQALTFCLFLLPRQCYIGGIAFLPYLTFSHYENDRITT